MSTHTEAQPRMRVAAVILRDNRILLVEHLKQGRRNYLLPGGGVEYGETLHQALVRELREETCLDVVPGRLLFVSESVAPDGARHMVQFAFAAEALPGEPERGDDPRVTAARFVSLDEIAALDMYPPLQRVLVDGARAGFAGAPAYLGNIWKDMDR